MTRRLHSDLGFEALRLEGALLSADQFARVAHGRDEQTQREEDYEIPRGLRLRDEIGRAFRIGQALWADVEAARLRQSRPAAELAERFVTTLLRQAFGFTDLTAIEPVELAHERYPLGYQARGRVPVVIAPYTLGLDQADGRFGSEGRRRSAFQLAQGFVNAEQAGGWALVCNGLRLRLLRDAASLTRPAYLEADLERIFLEERYADFSALWLLIHASRFDGFLERWREASKEEGSRVRERLREGVTEALRVLGDGFLRHPANQALRARLERGELSVEAYFQQLLRLIYRLIFLFTIEDRGLLHPPEADHEAVALYREGYALGRLRTRALRRAGYDAYHDLWRGLQVVWAGLATGQPLLALPALGGLYAGAQCPDLDGAELGNRALLTALRHLAWFREGAALVRVNYRDLGSEELGSVYESLLELVPCVDLSGAAAQQFDFVGGGPRGHARKLTGSYYTPESLVEQLLKSALDPVVERTMTGNPADPVAALLDLAVIDPACGSGHFLLGAGRRLAAWVALHRHPDGNPSAADYRQALREVISRCLFGVDRNPLAVELARMALWLEAYTPDAPLTFLDHHLLCGDALLGLLDLAVMRQGIPEEAFKALSGDDKEVCRVLGKQNREGRKQCEKLLGRWQLTLDFGEWGLTAALKALDAATDHTLEGHAAKQQAWLEAQAQMAAHPLAQAADLYVAAFLQAKTAATRATMPTSEALLWMLMQVLPPDAEKVAQLRATQAAATACCREARVLHWWFAFAQVFQRGGFDVVLGNPPWERIKLQEEEFFASRAPEIAQARNKAERERMIDKLEQAEPGLADRRLFESFIAARREAEAASVFAHTPARFPLTGVGDVNTYALFAETFARVLAPHGQAGLIVPTGIATDDSTKAFFAEIVQKRQLGSLYDFENRNAIFPGVHRSYKFCLLTLGRADEAKFVCFATEANQLQNTERRFTLTVDDLRRINPNTFTCPIFRSRADAELTKKIYRTVPVLIDENSKNGNPWNIRFQAMIHMSNDSTLFHDTPAPERLPLYEAKLIHQFDHRWATYSNGDSRDCTHTEKNDPAFTVTPRYWVDERQVLARIARVPRGLAAAWLAEKADDIVAELGYWLAGHLYNVEGMRGFETTFTEVNRWLATKASDNVKRMKAKEAAKDYPLNDDELCQLGTVKSNEQALELVNAWIETRSPRWLMGWRDICRSTDERTVIASVVPRIAVGHTLPLIFTDTDSVKCAALLANLNAMTLDYVARQKVGGTHLTYGFLKQFPIIPPTSYTQSDLTYIVPRILELTYTAHDLRPWAEDLGYSGPPFRWNPARRAELRAELDAYYARLYGLTRDELRYILDPADVRGAEYPSETFRVLREREIKDCGEYRTRGLVLGAWDKLSFTDSLNQTELRA